MRRLRLLVFGRVQGVFFRDSTRSEARRIGVRGIVRNLPDGSVEVVAEGPEALLQELMGWCHRGPPAARIDRVQPEWSEALNEFEGFRVQY